jgi:hypothetical protein
MYEPIQMGFSKEVGWARVDPKILQKLNRLEQLIELNTKLLYQLAAKLDCPLGEDPNEEEPPEDSLKILLETLSDDSP